MKNKVTIVTNIIENGLTGFGEQILQSIETLEGKRAKITIEEFRRPRTTKQNRYYWGVVLKMYQQYMNSISVYMSNDDLHLWIKEHVWGDVEWITVEKVDRDGVVTFVPMKHVLSSTLLDTQEWESRMLVSRAYAADNFNGMQIPEPSEKIDQLTLDWLNRPEGCYYGNEYKEYFNIVEPHQLAITKQ